MKYPSIRIEGAILSPDILDGIEDLPGQKPSDFGLESSIKVKDEIARAWADAQDYWRIFHRKVNALKFEAPATTETRQQWIVPLLGLLGYQLEYQPRGIDINGKLYKISFRATNRAHTPVEIIGYREPAGLDRRPERANVRMSAHAIVQEFINLNEQLYGLVTNGHVLRLLRDSSRLIKLSYLEFDLDRIFTDGLFADFAVLYRLLHASRLPSSNEAAPESWIERYHQDSLDSGARIREGLSYAVKQAISNFANGFLSHPANEALLNIITNGKLKPGDYYKHLLRLIYRLLFLMVIEERDLVFPTTGTPGQRNIYRLYYSVQRLRILSERRHLADRRRHDLWLSLLATFRLFEADGPGEKLGLAPLAGDLFGPDALGPLAKCTLGNDILLGCLRSLSLYEHPENRQLIRVNYGALNVEEFGSVYEGLLELEPVFNVEGTRVEFSFVAGGERAATGSHYTPDDLVQPLIKHSLDYLIAERLKATDPAAALLDLRVADIACGSGHILLTAARRIATELAIVRTGEDQPSPSAYRAALRDVICTCIYGVDLNPLAVELCKVALWLEAHNPGQPLNFLDHHIKCGNAIVGFVRPEDLDRGVPDEAFATMLGDDKKVASEWRKLNKKERKDHNLGQMQLAPAVQGKLKSRLAQWKELSSLSEQTPTEIEKKRAAFEAFTNDPDALLLEQIAAVPIAQFYIAKTEENERKIITDSQFRRYWTGSQVPQGQATGTAWATGEAKRFFHWFLEFPGVIARGGFDCILGNPPYLGGTNLSGTYGYPFCHYVKWEYAPAGLSDLVVYFVRRIYQLLKPEGFTAFITTNSIKDGDIRKDGLAQVLAQDGEINMSVRGIKWPGRANLVVSLVAIHKGKWLGPRFLDNIQVSVINSFFEETLEFADPLPIAGNIGKMLEGSKNRGKGFFISMEQARRLLAQDARNADVVIPILSGGEITDIPDQSPQRYAIFFGDWEIERAMQYRAPFELLQQRVSKERSSKVDTRLNKNWWRFERPRVDLYESIRTLRRCFAACATAKYLNFVARPTDHLFTQGAKVFTTDRWDLYAVVQSTLHEVWARKYSGALETRLRYSPSDCFETFAFPEGLWQTQNILLTDIGEQYHEHRKLLMISLWLGLTDLYNLFHTSDLSAAKVAEISKKPDSKAERGYHGILELRHLHQELDLFVRDAYDWQDLDLNHNFHEVETFPENDRIRYTISPDARKEILKRLLTLNYIRAEAETVPALPVSKPKGARKKTHVPTAYPVDELFAVLSYPVTDTDKAICAVSLAVVEQTGEVSSREHLDAVLLAAHPDWCKAFLSAKDQRKLDIAIADVPPGLPVSDSDSIRWSNARDYLELRKAININSTVDVQAISLGSDVAVVKRSLPAGVDRVVGLALKALEQIRELRKGIGMPSANQKFLLQIFDEKHQEYGVAA